MGTGGFKYAGVKIICWFRMRNVMVACCMIVCVCVWVCVCVCAPYLLAYVVEAPRCYCVPDKIFSWGFIKMNSFEVTGFYIVVNLTLIEDHWLDWAFWEHGAGENVWT